MYDTFSAKETTIGDKNKKVKKGGPVTFGLSGSVMIKTKN
jgi:hypothetical protein